LGMPDRDYYLKGDARSKELREKYLAHVANMFRLLGDNEDDARHAAGVVMAIETVLAKGTLTRVEQRDPRKLFYAADAHALQAMTPTFDWKLYFGALGLADIHRFNVSEPAFYRALETQLRTRSLDDVKAYLRWHLVHASAPFLSSAFVDE